MNVKPKLIDIGNELKIMIFNKNTNDLNIFICIIFIFIGLLVIIFSKNYSKKLAYKQVLSKLKYIQNKSNNYIAKY